MNAAASWALAAAALVAGFVGYGWPGVLLALTVIIFWLLLQFSRAVRTVRRAADRPLGTVASALMLKSKLHTGMRLPHILALTRSLGRRVDDASDASQESYAWRDAGGDEVVLHLSDGALASWQLQRGDPAP